MSKFINPKGFPEYLPITQSAFEYLKNTISQTYALYGFQYIETPAVEYLETLASSGDISKEIYAIARAKSEGDSSKGSDRGLRFDLTTPFARYVAQHQGHLSFPFRRYQIDRVWRGERPQKGRYRELYQADVDIVAKGELPLYYDIEVLEVIASTLDSLNLFDFTIRFNNREFLSKFLQTQGIDEVNITTAFNIVDKIAKVSADESVQRFVNECSLSSQSATKLLQDLQKTYTLTEAADLDDSFKYFADGLKDLELTRGEIILDLSIVRGLDYYTGFVYETTINGHEQYGSISSGGRYSNLVGRFSKDSFPGVGGSIGLSRLFFVLLDSGLIEDMHTPHGAYVLLLDENRLSSNQQIATYLRSQNIKTEIAREVAKFGKQLKYCEQKGYRFAVIVEEDGSLTLKDLVHREQYNNLNKEELVRYIHLD